MHSFWKPRAALRTKHHTMAALAQPTAFQRMVQVQYSLRSPQKKYTEPQDCTNTHTCLMRQEVEMLDALVSIPVSARCR